MMTEAVRRWSAYAVPALPLAATGWILAAIFFGTALTPSLMPRDPLTQGFLAGSAAMIGYGIGHIAIGVWRFLEIPRIDLRWRDQARRGAYAAALLIVLACLWRAAVWQNMTRAMMELPPVDSAHPLIIAIVAVGTFALLWCILMLFRVVLHRARLLLDQFVPPRVSLLVGFILVVWFFWALGQGVVLRFGFQIIDSSFSAADQLIEPETERPNDPTQTGSTASLVQWEVLGRWGRDYINRTPTASDIAEFAGPTAMQPVRVYVGLRAAETVQQRANLALRELIRAGGFERSTLVVMVPVGTGWMDPGGQDTLEFILGGDVATVAVQYSYLKGAFSVLANSEIGFAQSKALFDTIYQYWSKLPKNARPRFFVHGLSQGAQISQTTVPILDFLNDPIDGALWVGSPFFSPIWRRVRDARHSDSPAWLPRYGNGSLVRAANQKSGLEQYDAPWGPMRLVFLNYASDPIVLFSFASAYRRPDWLAQPRAFDVSPHLRWFPFVTMLQVALDTSLALDIPGYGHYYHARDYIDAWVAVLEPPNWTAEHSARLKLIFKQRAPAF